jgi:hypothetical protein
VRVFEIEDGEGGDRRTRAGSTTATSCTKPSSLPTIAGFQDACSDYDGCRGPVRDANVYHTFSAPKVVCAEELGSLFRCMLGREARGPVKLLPRYLAGG